MADTAAHMLWVVVQEARVKHQHTTVSKSLSTNRRASLTSGDGSPVSARARSQPSRSRPPSLMLKMVRGVSRAQGSN